MRVHSSKRTLGAPIPGFVESLTDGRTNGPVARLEGRSKLSALRARFPRRLISAMTAALPTNPRSWSVDHVQRFCVTEELFAGMADVLKDNEINGPAFLALTSTKLRDEMNVKSLGKRKAMLRRIAELEPSRRQSSDTSAASGAEACLPRSDSDSVAPVVCIDDASQEVLFELSVPMGVAPKSRNLVLHVVLLEPPVYIGAFTPVGGPQAGQILPHVVLTVMDSQGGRVQHQAGSPGRPENMRRYAGGRILLRCICNKV